VWITNSGNDTVTKLRARDGSLIGNYPVGRSPHGLAFDGVYMWVANTLSDSLSKR
jgi:DNA-binding beta-propeller fold protein YncE